MIIGKSRAAHILSHAILIFMLFFLPELVQDKTAIYISHRMSSCKFCDQIIVLDGGQILEEGTHETLLRKKGRYYALYSAQASYYIH